MRPWITPPAVLRALTPTGWIVVTVAFVSGLALVLALVLGGLGFRWDPLDLSRRRLESAERATAHARAEAASRSAEAEGQAGQVVRLDNALRTMRSLDRATTRSLRTARTADDASLPLSPARADRLRGHDRELCRIAPDLGGCAPAPDPAGAGDPAV